MSQNHYKLYLDSVFALAKTLSVKSEYSAAQTNTRLIQRYGPHIVDHSRPATWKYYLNRCGQYHSTDTMMRVTSLDTLQTIDFTLANLAIHTATAKAYRFGTRYYKELVAQYPEQEVLILGILYPADMAKALAAPDFSIISYDASLVEPNEESLIGLLQEWAIGYKRRWWVSDFNVNHSLYAASFFGVFYQALPLRILELRERACGTEQAHSFHVRMHLAGHNGLDEFLPYFTPKQAMYLYRNIAWHQRHAGNKHSFDALVQHLLTERGLPLLSYQLVHNPAGLQSGEASPEVAFLGKAVNGVRAASSELIAPQAMLNKIADVADGNEAHHLRNPEELENKKYSLQNSYSTKVLESTFVDMGEGSSTNTVEAALSLWVYAACTDRLNIYVRVEHPETGAEITMSALDAYYMFLYAFSKAHSNGLVNLPILHADNAPVWPVPSLARLWDICIQKGTNQVIIELMRASMPQPRTYLNIDQFQTDIEVVEEARNKHSLIVGFADSFATQASYKAVQNALWSDADYERPETHSDALEYFAARDMDVGELGVENWQKLYLAIFTAVTGLDMQTTAARSKIQRAMIEVMRRLSSYTVLFVEPLSTEQTRSLNYSNLIVEESATTASTLYDVPIHNSAIELIRLNEKIYFGVDIGPTSVEFWIEAEEGLLVLDNTSDILFLSEDNDNTHEILLAQVGISAVDNDGEPDDSLIYGLEDVLIACGEDPTYYTRVMNQYNYHCWPRTPIPTQASLDDLILTAVLPILQPPAAGPVRLGDFQPLSIPQRLRYFSDDTNVIELNGIWPNYGADEVPVFRPSITPVKVDMFRLLPYFETSLTDWKPSIGNLITEKFDLFGGVPDYTELSPFVSSSHANELGIYYNHMPLTMTLDFQFMGNATFSLQYQQPFVDFGLSAYNREANLNPFAAALPQIVTTLNAMPFVADIGTFVSNFVPIEGMAFTNISASYQSLILAQNAKFLDNGRFYSYASVEVKGLNTDTAAQSREFSMEMTNHNNQLEESLTAAANHQKELDLQSSSTEQETQDNTSTSHEIDILDFPTKVRSV